MIFDEYKYTFTDGLIKRFLYLFGYILILLLIIVLPVALFLIYFFNNPNQPVAYAAMIILPYTSPLILGFVFMLLDSVWFLFPYIVQDTLSEDNVRKPLSFLSCLRKSWQLTKGSRLKYLLIMYGLRIWIGSWFSQLLTPLILSFGLSFIFGIISYITVHLFTQVFLAVWADELMARDQSIVNYGD